MTPALESSQALQLLIKATVAALSVAALAGLAVLLGGDFSHSGLRVLATATLLGLACTVAASGADLARRPLPRARLLGTATCALAALAFADMTAMIWDVGGETFADAAWTLAILAVESGLAAFLLARRQAADSRSVRTIVAGGLAATAGSTIVALGLAWDLVEGDAARALGAFLIVQIFAAVVPSLLRRTGRSRPAAGYAVELEEIAARLERSTPLARDEVARLRELARATR